MSEQQVWRIVGATGAVREVSVEQRGSRWVAVSSDGESPECLTRESALSRVIGGWPGIHREILAPGDRPRADLIEEACALRAERDRLQRACDEGLPREHIECPACGFQHLEGARFDNPQIDGRTRPHHTHRCSQCGNVWDAGRWSFGADVPKAGDALAAARQDGAEAMRATCVKACRAVASLDTLSEVRSASYLEGRRRGAELCEAVVGEARLPGEVSR